MSWNSFTYAMGNLSNMFKFANGMFDKQSGNITDRLKNSGTELLGNTIALRTARDTRTYTGSSLGYTGFFSAQNSSEALQNTMGAADFAMRMYTPMYYNNYGNTYSGYGMSNMGLGSMNYMYGNNFSSSFGGNFGGGFNNNRFRGYWA